MKSIKWIVALLVTLNVTMISAEEKKNIVLLFVDDLGWADLGFRNPIFHTPNIDKLREDGMDFERAYIPTPTCSPSRASLLTGKESARIEFSRHITHENMVTGFNSKEYNYWEKDPVQRPSRNWLPKEEVTYAERLKEEGYYNMFIGKWHLGHEGYFPTTQGFDDMYGTNFQGHPKSYYAPFFKSANPLEEFKGGEYLTDVLTDKAVDFISSYQKEEPFMMSMWYYTVHGPQIGRKDYLKKYREQGLEGKYADYGAMISVLDESVGRVRTALEEKGIADNTVIIFLSDQGGVFKNGPLSGGKRGGNTLGEGGARVPLLILNPGVTTPGTITSTPVSSIDIYPTLMEIATGKNYKNKEIQGISLMPLMQGKEIAPRKLFFLRSYEDQYAAVINGDWKLVKYHSGKYELFNIKNDISEQNNLVEQEVNRFNHMKKDLAKWEKNNVPTF